MSKRIVWLSAALVLLGTVGTYVLSLEDTSDVDIGEKDVVLPVVSYVTAQAADNTGHISVFAEVRPRWTADLKAQVSGKLLSVAPQALEGKKVSKNEVMAQLEKHTYEAQLEDAKYQQSTAEFNLKKKQNKHVLALKNWRAVNPKEAPPEMAVHIPELRVAEKALKAAVQKVKVAQYDVNATTIKAPFSGFVTKRHVSIGQSISVGDTLFTLLDAEQLDITVSLDQAQWNLLEKAWQEFPAKIYNANKELVGLARIQRGGGFLDPKSRRYQLFLEIVKSPETTVLPGEFVKVELQSKTVNDSLKLPATVLTQEGFIWFLNNKDELQRFEASVVFRNDTDIIVKMPNELQEMDEKRVVQLPMAAFLPGQHVAPTPAGH
ncbi:MULTISPECIES: efflux RND transporter periplasmic adaptor subunit [unclassified Pseudovibrio]|uniref:efflux RND transporter periplasmic adaptor subunit n=1 Tax=unclassified Pseudovibrio TaxID=2627060 RepID=UPI0007AE8A76|nr:MULTISPECIES: efflux RND transporter periplasmic adaptor subunit [unclassified Pseudovibrio]KZK98807.1 Solvent efflux pump periplasmic linker SrpA precursor [Pseudovibrio sp. W74]KZL09300.1 Solvent efflux pump periplasmic linker SrpA precursor [Pseudovibrio sp. Ad14]